MGGRGLDLSESKQGKVKGSCENHWLSQNPGNFLRSRVIITFAAGGKHARKKPLRRHER
jgi:hypothetical protein